MQKQFFNLLGSEIHLSRCFLDQLTKGYPRKNVAVRFWDGATWGNTQNPSFTLVLNHPGALAHMFSSPSDLALGEAFIYEQFDIEGDFEAAFEFGDFILTREYTLMDKLRLRALLFAIGTKGAIRDSEYSASLEGHRHSKERDRKAIAHHYDLSNDFYSLWLDPLMVYSCGYFKSLHDDLETAQVSKLDYICKKLRLKPGERLLDLGCGWGGFLIHAAKKYRVEGIGITLSVAQAELARERIKEAGLSSQCRIEVCDYRDLDYKHPFDKLVSIGMFEHVGEALLIEYFHRAFAFLRPGGVFLNHGIASSAHVKYRGPSFIDKYVFPDGELVPINVSLHAAEACGFEVRDVESLREHYKLTLKHWAGSLNAHAQHAAKLIGHTKYRVWKLYLLASAHSFNDGQLNLYQVLLSKPAGGQSRLPLTREDWYE